MQVYQKWQHIVFWPIRIIEKIYTHKDGRIDKLQDQLEQGYLVIIYSLPEPALTIPNPKFTIPDPVYTSPDPEYTIPYFAMMYPSHNQPET